MRFAASEPGLENAAWIPYAVSYSDFNIGSGGDGEKTVWAEFTDEAGNTPMINTYDMVYFDSIPPGQPLISGISPTNDRTPAWNWESGGQGNGTYRFRLNDSNIGEGEPVSTIPSYTPSAPLNEGFHTLYVQERDEAGNWSAIASRQIEIRLLSPAVSAVSPVESTTPTFTWSGMSGPVATGQFRYKPDDDNLNTGAVLTTSLSFTPENALSQGEHTLYVQEKDADGLWSKTGSATVLIESPADSVIVSPLNLNIAEPVGSASFTIRLAVKPRFPVSFDLFTLDNRICTLSPVSVTLTPEDWNTGRTLSVTDADFNLINTEDTFIEISDAVSDDVFYNSMTADSVRVTVSDDAAFAVYSVMPQYALEGQYNNAKIYGNGFDPGTEVYYTKIGTDGTAQTEKKITRVIVGSTRIDLGIPDKNQDPLPLAGERYVLRITDGEKDFTETVFIVSQADLDAVKRKKALIVAGGGEGYDGDYLWGATQFCTETAWEALEFQGYTWENIRFLSAGDADPERDATLENIQKAVTEWGHESFVPGFEIDELLIYMTDHGTDGRFTLKGSENLDLEAWRLKMWLDELQSNHPEIRVIVIYDACQSGSFIEILKKYPATAPYERIILTGASADQDALFADQGKLSFSDAFWNSVMKAGFLYRSFKHAESEMAGLGQFPQIEIPGQYDYTDSSKDLKIGLGLFTGASPIDIKEVCPEQLVACGQTQTEIWVRNIVPPDNVRSVSARIRFYDGDTDPDTVISTVPLLPAEDLRYEGVFDNFSKTGTYYISFYATDMNDKESEKVHTTVRQICGGVIVKGDMDATENLELKDAVIALQILSGIRPPDLRPDYTEHPELDVNGDLSVGMEEAVFVLRKAAGL